MERVMRRAGASGKRTMMFALLSLLALAGCGSKPAEPAPDTAGPDTRAEIRGMAEGARNAVFIRAIRDAGQTCQNVTGSAYQREAGPESLWTATCDGNALWAVYVARNGGARVAACKVPSSGGAPTCT